jgi:hypothetical protein
MDGTSTAADAALAIVHAEKGIRSSAAAALDADAPPLVEHADAGDGSPSTIKRAEFDALNETARRAVLAAGTKIV